MQALYLMLLLVGVVMGGPLSSQPNADSSALLSPNVDNLGSENVLAGNENNAFEDADRTFGNSDLALGSTGLFEDTGLDFEDSTSALADMEEVYLDDELVPLVLLIPRNMLNNLPQIYCGEDCDPDAIFPGQTATPVVRRKKRGVGAILGAIAAWARTAARATATGVRTAGRATAGALKTAAQKTATARRVLGKVASQVERGTLLYYVIDQANQLAKLQQEVIVLKEQYDNAGSRPEKQKIVEELLEKRVEATNLLDSIDQIAREFEEADYS